MWVAVGRIASYVDEVPSASFRVRGISYELLIARTEYYGLRMAENGPTPAVRGRPVISYKRTFAPLLLRRARKSLNRIPPAKCAIGKIPTTPTLEWIKSEVASRGYLRQL